MKQNINTKPIFIRLIAFLFLGCFIISAGNALGAQAFNFTNFNSTTGLVFNGGASQVGGQLHLTPAAPGVAGSVWFSGLQEVRDGFSTSFQFQTANMWLPGGGADGFTFIIQNSSAGTAALGWGGGLLGYAGNYQGFNGVPAINNSIAVEFDTFANGANFGDSNGNHISVHYLVSTSDGPNAGNMLGTTSSVPDLNDGAIHSVSIVYVPGTLSVSIDGSLVLSVPLNLAATINLNRNSAYPGFTGATGAEYEEHNILNWSFDYTPIDDPPIGTIDAADCTAIQGWAFDWDATDTSISVHLYDGTTFLGAYPTDVARGDVNLAYGINGVHGYYIPTPASLKNGANHSIYVYGINSVSGVNALLSNSPQNVLCNPPPTPTPTPTPPPTPTPTPTSTPTPTPTPIACISCPAPPSGCFYQGANCQSCGTLVCGSPGPTDASTAGKDTFLNFRIFNPLAGGAQQPKDIFDVIFLISNWILNIAGSLIVILIIYGGVIFMLSRGNPGEIQKAKNILFWAIAGFFVILIGKGFIFIVDSVLRGQRPPIP